MTTAYTPAGYFRGGLPYNRFGSGPHTLVIFQGLFFENKPLPRLASWYGMYTFLGRDYTAYMVMRRPGLSDGCSLKNMADDYAAMIREEFGGPVDVIGSSTGGSIAQHFAADHPDLVRKLVLHSSAHTLGDVGKEVQMRVAHLARRRQWRAAYTAIMSVVVPRRGTMRVLGKIGVGLASFVMALPGMCPKDPSDLIVTIEAEDRFQFKDRLAEITAPTLVIAGDQDPFYSEALFRETAAGIPNARLVLYKGKGHTPSGKPFQRDVLAFLRKDDH